MFLLVSLLLTFSQQPQVPQPASIEGIVVTMGTGQPLAGAKVAVDPAEDGPGQDGPIPCANVTVPDMPESCGPKTTTTGADGRFVLSGVTPGTYRLYATRNGGYVPAEFGQRTATGEGISFQLAPGQMMTGVVLQMSPTGTITGRVYDRDGEPLGKAQVQALRSVYRDGRRTMTIIQSVETNDRGEYRLFWLAPGQYYVSAKPDIPTRGPNLVLPGSGPATAVRVTDPARFGTYEQGSVPVVRKRALKTGEVIEETSIPVYFPGVVDMQMASALMVGAGTVTGGVDISIAPGIVQTHHIRGRVIDGSTGQPLARASVRAIPRTLEPLRSVPAAQSDTNGFFDLAGAVPGSYFLIAEMRNSGVVEIEVGNRDLNNLAVVTPQGFRLSGRLIVEGRPASYSRLTGLRIARLIRDPDLPVLPSTGSSSGAAEDGSFTMTDVAPGDFRVQVGGLGSTGYVKSMRMGNDDVLDGGLHIRTAPENPLEIVIGLDAGAIQGTVVNTRQQALPNRRVTLIPDVRLRHRADLYQSVQTDSAGRFRLQGIPPGNYKLFAWEGIETGAWLDAAFIRDYEDRGTTVSVRPAGSENMQLTVIP